MNTSYLEYIPSVSSDGLELYLSSPIARAGMAVTISTSASVPTRNDPWGDPVNLGPAVNTPGDELAPSLSPDGLLLVFQDNGGGVLRPGGYGNGDLWMTRRASRSAPWGPPVNLGPIVNGPTSEQRPCWAPDGSALYFTWFDASGNVLGYWKAPILPIVDFNGDGKVDEKDMAMLLADWGMSNWMSVCDIGPYRLGRWRGGRERPEGFHGSRGEACSQGLGCSL